MELRKGIQSVLKANVNTKTPTPRRTTMSAPLVATGQFRMLTDFLTGFSLPFALRPFGKPVGD